jgi:hypothetical protein
MAAVTGNQMSPVNARCGTGSQVEQAAQNQILQAQRIPGNGACLPDAVHLKQAFLYGFHAQGDLFRRQERSNLFIESLCREQHRQPFHHGLHEMRQTPGNCLHPHTFEQPALPERLFHRQAARDKKVRIVTVQPNVYGQLVLERVVREKMHGVRDDRIILGERGDDIGVDVDTHPGHGEHRGGRNEHQEKQGHIGAGRLHFHSLFRYAGFVAPRPYYMTIHSNTPNPARCTAISTALWH